MGATFPIITGRVGEGGKTSGIEVKRIQQLLKLAEYDVSISGTWDEKTKQALIEFQKDLSWGPVVPYIDQEDPYFRLFTLAYAAGVLLDLPKNLRSQSAALTFYETCRDRNIVYGWKDKGKVIGGGTHTVWGFAKNPGHAVAAIGVHVDDAEFDLKVPFALNCTSFANLMLSVWFQGNAHGGGYDRSQGDNPLLPVRYGIPPAPNFYVLNPVGAYKSYDTLKSAMDPSCIYYMGLVEAATGILKHDTVVFDETVYECNLDRTPAVYSTPLKERWQRFHAAGAYATLYGPGPF